MKHREGPIDLNETIEKIKHRFAEWTPAENFKAGVTYGIDIMRDEVMAHYEGTAIAEWADNLDRKSLIK